MKGVWSTACAASSRSVPSRRPASAQGYAAQDIAILTGATVISDEVGLKLEQATINELGTAKRIQISKAETTLIDGAGANTDI